jgi:hypothetical protein
MIGSPLADTLPVQPFAGAFAGGQRQRLGAQADARHHEQAEDEGFFHGPDSATDHRHCQQLQALGNGGGGGIGPDFAPALIGHVADDQLRGVLLGGRHDLADAPQDKVHLRLVAGKEKPVGPSTPCFKV